MTASDTHREAVEAMVSALDAEAPPGRVGSSDQAHGLIQERGVEAALGGLLDAIPAGVLARLAVERGGLELCGYVDHTLEPLVFGTPGELVTEVEHLHDGDQPVYRIVEASDE